MKTGDGPFSTPQINRLMTPQKKSALNILNDMIDGESSETKSMKNLIAMVSQTDSSALILGVPFSEFLKN